MTIPGADSKVDSKTSKGVNTTQQVKFFRDVTTTFATTLISFIFLLIGSIITARVLQPEGKGVYTTFRTSADFAMMIASFGVGKSLTFYISKNEIGRSQLLRTSLALSFVEGIAGVVVFFCLSLGFTLNFAIKSDATILLLVCLPIPLINALNNWSTGYLRGQQLIPTINLATNLRVVSYVVLTVLLVFLGWLNPATALIASIAGMVLMLVVQVTNLPYEKHTFMPQINLPIGKLLIIYGFAYQVCSALQNLHYRLDILLIAGFLGDVQVGYYSLSANTAQLTWQLPQAISLVLLPFLATLPDGHASIKRTAMIARVATICMVLSAGLMALTADLLIPLIYGQMYQPAIMPLRLLMPGMITGGLSLVLGSYFLTQGKQLPFILINGMGLALNGALNVWAIPTYGILGSAVVSSTTSSLIYATSVLYLARSCQLPVHYFVVCNRQDVEHLRSVAQRLWSSISVRVAKILSK